MADLDAMEGRLDKSYLRRKSDKRGNSIHRNVTPSRSTKPIPRSAPKEVPDERWGFWHGVMCSRLREQEREPGFEGFYRCMCGEPDCNASIEGFDEARRFFVPGHLKPRAEFRTKGFRRGRVSSLGPDDPDNIVPVTRECNAAEFYRRHVK